MSQLLSFEGIVTHFSPVRTSALPRQLSILRLLLTSTAMRCDERGEFLTSDSLPVLPPVQPATDWFPFNSHVGFELAELLFAEAELSKKKVNHLLELWAATLVPHSAPPPITNHADLLRQIDSIPLGDVSWESFSLGYDDPPPTTASPPEWKTTEYEVWFRNPREVIKGILRNPEFDGHIDYSAYREFDDSQRRYCHMMSGDWAWRQSVRDIRLSYIIFAIINPRTGRDLHRPIDTWCDVCPNHPWIGQDHSLRRNWSKRVLSPLSFDW
jgi:hypothetical protein